MKCLHAGCNQFALTLADSCWNHHKNHREYRRLITETVASGQSLNAANLTEADLNRLDLAGINALETNFTGAILENTILKSGTLADCIFRRCKMSGLNLDRAKLSGSVFDGSRGAEIAANNADFTDVSAKHCIFKNISLVNSVLKRSNWTGSDLEHADLTGVHASEWVAMWVNLSQAKLVNADLGFAVLGGANLNGIRATESDFSRANLIGILAESGNFRSSRFFYARLTSACFDDADLSQCDLTRTIFRCASLINTKFDGSVQEGTIFDRAIFNRQHA